MGSVHEWSHGNVNEKRHGPREKKVHRRTKCENRGNIEKDL